MTTPTTRTFVAIRLPVEIRDALYTASMQLHDQPGGRAARWVAPENIHLTLKFLGDVDDRQLCEVCDALAKVCAGIPSFEMAVSGLGCFPNAAHPRIVWAGVSRGAGELIRLATSMDVALNRLGFARETRPFDAHITLGRADRRAARAELVSLGRTIAEQSTRIYGSMTVTRVSVVKSDLRPSGPVYTDIATAALGHA